MWLTHMQILSMKIILLIVFGFTLFACNSHTEQTDSNEILVDSLAIQLNDSALERYQNYAFGIDSDKKNLELAIQELDQAIEIEPEVALYYSNKAQILLAMEKDDEAIKTLQKVIEFQPYHAEILSMIGFIYERNKRNSEARNWYERSYGAYEKRIEENRYVINSKINLAFLKFFLQDEEAAITAYNDLKDRYPESDEVLFMEYLFKDFDREKFLQDLYD
jgi:tetratricopeptide (TPR) repeat protein